jgi:Icc-related predicted phosphoesterase
MRILVVADIHYSLKQYDWLVAVARDYDLVVLAGDLLEVASIVDRAVQVVVVRNYLEDITRQTRLVVCSGNHDLDSRDAAGELFAAWMLDLAELGVVSDQETLELGDTLVTVCPWWDGPESRAAIGRHLAETAGRRRGRWVWVYHAPPANSPVSWSGRRHFGDEALSDWITTFGPDIVLSGHVHGSPFVAGGSWADRIGKTWVFNTGQQIGATPAHIVIDLEQWQAAWLSIEGLQVADLAQPPQQPFQAPSELPNWLRA